MLNYSYETQDKENLTTIESTTKLLWSILSPIIFIVGITANILAVIVLYRLQRQSISVGVVYRIVLAISDMTILCTGLSRYWILYLFDYDIRGITNAGCKIYLFVIYVSMQYSSWVLVSLTVQRCLVVNNPLRFKNIWTVKVSWIQLSILFIFLSLIDCHYFFTNGIKNGTCDSLTDEILEFEEHYFVFIDLAVLCLIPFLIMFIGNLYFLKNMRGIREIRRSLTEGQRISQPRRQNTKLIMKMTWLFLFTTLPICAQMIADSFVKGYDKEKDLAKAVCYLFQYFGVSLNICIYITNDRKFRQQLKKLFKLKHTFIRRGTNNSQFFQSLKTSSSYNTSSKENSLKEKSNISAVNIKNQIDQVNNIQKCEDANRNSDENCYLSTHM